MRNQNSGVSVSGFFVPILGQMSEYTVLFFANRFLTTLYLGRSDLEIQ
jgi:hypothetical protein